MRSSLFLLLWIPVSVFAQSDEINISASFAQSIELRVTGGASIEWTFTTITHYKNGFTPNKRTIDFQVASSVNFSVQFEMSALTNANGDEIDLSNFTIRPSMRTSHIENIGTRLEFAEGNIPKTPINSGGIYRGDYFSANEGVRTLFIPGPDGNAGSFDDNTMAIAIGLGCHSHSTKNWGASSLLDQNITPGTYTGTMTLTALPVAL